MFDTRFNSSFYVPNNQDMALDQDFSDSPLTNDMNGYNLSTEPMPGNTTEDVLYPAESGNNSSFLNVPVPYPAPSYARGGRVRAPRQGGYNLYPSLAEMIRQQGVNGDTVLAHINPIEQQILSEISGGGSINPSTGLPQYFWNPWKAIKSVFGGGAGAIIGNMILPGVGGILGGAFGQAMQDTIRNKKNFGQSILKGSLMGAALPSAASLVGSGAKALGANNLGGMLSGYGNRNAIIPAIDGWFGGATKGSPSAIASGARAASGISPMDALKLAPLMSPNRGLHPTSTNLPISGVSAGDDTTDKASSGFFDKLLGNTSDFLTQPSNLLTTAIVGNALFNRPKAPKEKSPEQLANEHKRYQQALMLSPAEMQQREAQLLAEEQMKRRIARNKFLPEERFADLNPRYVRTNTPEEYSRQGRWLSYYDNPRFTGEPLFLKGGGQVVPSLVEMIETNVPMDNSFLFDGSGSGQQDNRGVNLPPKSYIVDATTVSNLGDGNTNAGAKKIQAWVSDGEMYIPPEGVAAIGKRYNKDGATVLDTLVKNVRRHKGGSTKLPPKAKSLTSYIA